MDTSFQTQSLMHGRVRLDLLLRIHPDLVFETWTWSDGRATIDLLRVPERCRRQGLGSMVYRAWEKTVPEGTKVVIAPVDEVARAFWLSLGFHDAEHETMVRIASEGMTERPSSMPARRYSSAAQSRASKILPSASKIKREVFPP